MRLLLLFPLLAGCGAVSMPGQDRAEQIVWREVYGMTEAPPPIEWIPMNELSPSVGGRTLAPFGIQVACGNGAGECGYEICATTFAHELMHWRSWLQTGDVDPAHFRADWDLVEVANHRLASDGDLKRLAIRR